MAPISHTSCNDTRVIRLIEKPKDLDTAARYDMLEWLRLVLHEFNTTSARSSLLSKVQLQAYGSITPLELSSEPGTRNSTPVYAQRVLHLLPLPGHWCRLGYRRVREASLTLVVLTSTVSSERANLLSC